MATNPWPSIKPPGIETLRHFDLNDDYDPEQPEHCDLAQPDNCGPEKDNLVRDDEVPDSARFTSGGGQDWRDEVLDEVRSALLNYMQPDDAGDIEQNNVLIEWTNASTVGFQVGIAVRKVCEQFTFEKTNRIILLDSVTHQEDELTKVKAQNETLVMRLAEFLSRQEEVTTRVAAENEELRMRLSEALSRQDVETKRIETENEELRTRLSEAVSRQDEETKRIETENVELRMRLSEAVSRQDEETKRIETENEELRMRLSESVCRYEEQTKKVKARKQELRRRFSEYARKQEVEIKNLSAENEELRMMFSESAGKQEEDIRILSAQNEEVRKKLLESVSRKDDVIKNLMAQKEELQCKLIDSFLTLRPQRPACDSACSHAFRISAINEPGNSALSTHQYRAGYVDPTPLVGLNMDQPAEKHSEDVHALELPNNHCPQFPRSLKRRRTVRPRMQTRDKSALEKSTVKHLASEEEHVQEALQSPLTDRSPMPTAAPREDDHVMRVDHAVPDQVGEQSPRASEEGCDSTSFKLKGILGPLDTEIAPHDGDVSPCNEDVQSAGASRRKHRPRVYQEYVCGVGPMSCKVTLGATWNAWDYVGSHVLGRPAHKWWDHIWVQDGDERQVISRNRNMDVCAAINRRIMQKRLR